MHSSSIFFTLFIISAVSGCVSSDSHDGFDYVGAPFPREAVEYTVTSSGESIGIVRVSYTIENGSMLADVRGDVAGQLVAIDYTMDPATLARETIASEGNTRFPWGEGRWGAHSHSFLGVGIAHPDLLLPIGIQRVGQGQPAGWAAHSQVDCAQSCIVSVGGVRAIINITAHSESASFLPTMYRTSIVGFDEESTVEVTLQARDKPGVSSEKAQFEPAPPDRLVDSKACGLAPCEPEGWPLHLSFQAALDSAELHPLWLLHNQDEGHPLEMAVFAPGFLDSDALVGSRDIIWVLGLRNADGTTSYTLRASGVADGTYGPVIVDSGTQRPVSGLEMNRTWPLPVAPLDESLETWLAQADETLGDVVSLHITGWPSSFNPNPHAQFDLFITLGEPQQQRYIIGSLTDGGLRGFGSMPSAGFP